MEASDRYTSYCTEFTTCPVPLQFPLTLSGNGWSYVIYKTNWGIFLSEATPTRDKPEVNSQHL